MSILKSQQARVFQAHVAHWHKSLAFGKQLQHKLFKRKGRQSEKVRGNWTGGEQEALSRLQRVCADVAYAAGP